MPNLPLFFDPKDMSRARLLEWFDEALSFPGAAPEGRMTPLEGLYAKEALYQYYAASWVEHQAKIGAEKGLPRPWETEGGLLNFCSARIVVMVCRWRRLSHYPSKEQSYA